MINLNNKIYFKDGFDQKNVFLWMHKNKLLNKYFFSNKDFIRLNINSSLIEGIFFLFIKLIKREKKLIKCFLNLPNIKNLKQFFINLNSLIFFSLIDNKFSKGIFVLGDIDYPIYKALLLSSSFFPEIEIWIIYQGSGSMHNKIQYKYNSNVRRVYFPFSKSLLYERNLLKKNSKKNHIKFYNIDTTLKFRFSDLNNIAIFQGYNKKRRLYPFYIIFLIKIFFQLSNLKEYRSINSITIFLHPRLKYLKFLNIFFLNKRYKLENFKDKNSYSFKNIISYSPTINSSLETNIKEKINFIEEYGINFTKENVQKKILKLI